jgi:hypothetical protein
MAYVATNYMANPKAPVGKWVCAPTSALGPYDAAPLEQADYPDLCGQCVSYVKQVCPSLPATGAWKKGKSVKSDTSLAVGTVIATFNALNKYEGHAAIYVSQNPDKKGGISVYDQYVYGSSPKAVGPRTLRWGALLKVNNGDMFFVVD